MNHSYTQGISPPLLPKLHASLAAGLTPGPPQHAAVHVNPSLGAPTQPNPSVTPQQAPPQQQQPHWAEPQHPGMLGRPPGVGLAHVYGAVARAPAPLLLQPGAGHAAVPPHLGGLSAADGGVPALLEPSCDAPGFYAHFDENYQVQPTIEFLRCRSRILVWPGGGAIALHRRELPCSGLA